MLKKAALVLLALTLLALPAVARVIYYYTGTYDAKPVPRPDLSQIEEPTPAIGDFADRPVARPPGTILLDMAHDNRFETAELSVLRARLAARGQQLQATDDTDDLMQRLRNARALVIVSPGRDWTPDEIQAAETFVEKGGRMLLVGDPTRFEVFFPDDFSMSYILDYDATHLNDLAARYGILFGHDYLYNTVENEGNYRNIRLDDFAGGALTEGLDQVVFYAAHSISSQEPALIAAGGETRSSTSQRGGDLAVAVLAADGSVLALSDLTFMTEPYNAAYDNDRFLSNIADFLSGAERLYDLADFPYYFDERVELVYAGDPVLNDSLLESGSALQALLAQQDVELTLVDEENIEQDTLFFGLYDEAEEVEPYLADVGVTLVLSPTVEGNGEPAPEAAPEPVSATITGTVPATATVGSGEAAGAQTPAETEAGRIEIASLGDLTAVGTALLLFQDDGERQVLLVLADSATGLDRSVERLADGDLSGCLLQPTLPGPTTSLALCPTGEGQPDDTGGWQAPAQPEPSPAQESPPPEEEPEDAPAGEPAGRILILALDGGEARYEGMTGADDYAALLEDDYEVVVWSVTQDGEPRTSDVLDYDLVIWTAGDFDDAIGDAEQDLLLTLMIEGRPSILSGAYIGEAEGEAVQRDVEVVEATHPLAQGFETGDVISFVGTPSGEAYEMDVLEDLTGDEETIVLVRGPESEASGVASLAALQDEFSGMRIVFVGFPIYMLPEAARSQLVSNCVSWVLGP
jgi:hypothetical protein